MLWIGEQPQNKQRDLGLLSILQESKNSFSGFQLLASFSQTEVSNVSKVSGQLVILISKILSTY